MSLREALGIEGKIDLNDDYNMIVFDPSNQEHLEWSNDLSVELYNQCQFRCPTCYSRKNMDGKKQMSLDEYKAVIDLPLIMNVGLSMAEPTLHPDISDIVDYTVKKKNTHMTLYSNGLDKDKIKQLISENQGYGAFFEIRLSLDTEHKAQYEVRGLDILKNAKDIMDYARENSVDIDFTMRNLGDKESLVFLNDAIRYLGLHDNVTQFHNQENWDNESEVDHFKKRSLGHTFISADGNVYDNNFDYTNRNSDNAIAKLEKKEFDY